MQSFKLANILLENTPQLAGQPRLICRADCAIQFDDTGVATLPLPGRYDFTTFFNALSVKKWHSYTVCERFHLHLEVRGAALNWTQTRADTFNWTADEIASSRQTLAASPGWQSYDFALTVAQADVLVGFVLETTGPVDVRGSFYWADVPQDSVRLVELALCTTTFKKEAFIERNIRIIKEGILALDEPLAHHFRMHVIDNGRTLNAQALEVPGRIEIHPNANAGGAGGFARGMIEAMEQTPRATHVLLMDDDVAVLPESIVRTYSLLSLVRDEYAEAFVSGAMMSMDECDLLWEDMGYVAPDGRFYPLKQPAHMSDLHATVNNEARLDIDPAFNTGEKAQHYAAWWYCVIPMAVIDRHGLPLPLFVRSDDVEYSLRCKPRFMTMNGICVWHQPFTLRYDAAVERYQMMRNIFIAQASSQIAPLSTFTDSLRLIVRLELKKFNYTNAALALEGFEDFLRGPSFIAEPIAERCFVEAHQKAEKLVPFDELERQAASEGIELQGLQVADIIDEIPRSALDRLLDLVTCNGQRIDCGYVQNGTHAIIDAAGWEYPAGRIRRKDTLVAIDLPSRRGVVRHMDRTQYRALWKRLNNDLRYFKQHETELEEAYSQKRAELTSVAFWKTYLGMKS